MKASKHQQVSVEYLSTYGIAILIVSVVAVVLYLLITVPQSIPPSLCTFPGYVDCKIAALGSNALGTKAVLLLSNTQQYPVENEVLTVNLTGFGSFSSKCSPSYVLPGGDSICVLNTSTRVTPYQLLGGTVSLAETVCTNPSIPGCSSPVPQTYEGSIAVHVNPQVPSPQCTLTLTATNSTQVSTGQLDKLVSNVKLLGTEIAGATVNLTTTSPNAVISSSPATTDSYGNATSYASSTSPANALIRSTFANCNATTSILFQSPVYITFNINQTDPASIFKLDNMNFSSFPVTKAVLPGTAQSYSYNSSILVSQGVRLSFASASGCGYQSLPESGSIQISSSCTVTGYYKNQAYLTMQANPSSAGNPTPSSGWYNLGPLTLSSNPNSGYAFSSWSGSGPGNYTGTSATPTITLTSPLTETANYQLSKYQVTTYANPAGDGTETGAGNYTPNQVATITASPASGWVLASWSCTGSATASCPSGNQSSFEFQVTSAATVTANYDPSQYYLTLYYECEDGSGQQLWGNYGPYNYGQQVTLPGILDEYYDSSEGSYCQFSYWYGQMGYYQYQNPTFIIPYGGYYGSYPGEVFSSQQVMTAFFTTYCPYGGEPPYNCNQPPTTTSTTTLSTTTISGPSCNNGDIGDSCCNYNSAEMYYNGECYSCPDSSQLTPYSGTTPGCACPSGETWNGNDCVQQPTTTYYTLTETASPINGGAVGSTYASNDTSGPGTPSPCSDCTFSVSLPAGTQLYLDDIPNSGYQFQSWSGSGSGSYSGTGTGTSAEITMNGNINEVANFQQVSSYEYQCTDNANIEQTTTGCFIFCSTTCEVQSFSYTLCEPSNMGSSFTLPGPAGETVTSCNAGFEQSSQFTDPTAVTCTFDGNTNCNVNECPSDTVYSNGECIGPCPSGQQLSYVNGGWLCTPNYGPYN